MIKRLIFTLAMLCTMAVIPSKGQAIIAGQPCGAPGVSAIATNGQAVLCQGSPLVWTAPGGSGSGGGVGNATNSAAPAMAFYLSNQCPTANTGQCFYTPADTQEQNNCNWSAASTLVTCVLVATPLNASVSSNVATYTEPSVSSSGAALLNFALWKVGDSVTVSGFGGADTFFNQTCTLTAVTTLTIQCALVHANASSTTQGSVTDNTSGPFSSADALAIGGVFKQVKGSANCAGDLAASAYVSPISTGATVVTIASFVNSRQVNISQNPANAVASAGCFIWGHPDDAGAALVDAAMQVSTQCPKLFLASSNYLFTNPHWYVQPYGCVELGTLISSNFGNVVLPAGFEIEGRGTGPTAIFLASNFPNGDSCTHNSGPGSTNVIGCFAIPMMGKWSDFRIDGGGQNDTTLAGLNLIAMQIATLENFTCINMEPFQSTVTGILMGWQGQLYQVNNSGCGGVGLAQAGNTGSSIGYRVVVENSGQSSLSLLGASPVDSSGVHIPSFICHYCDLGGANGQANTGIITNTGGYVQMISGQISQSAGPSLNNQVIGYKCNGAGGIAIFDGVTFQFGTGSANNFNASLNVGSSNCITRVKNSTLSAQSAGYIYTDNLQAGGVFDFQEGNTIVTGPFSAARIFGSILADGHSVTGICTGVGTASSTLALNITGLSTSGTGIPTTCTSTTLDKGLALPQARTAAMLNVTSTAAGVNASSGVVTVLKNGVATTLTCTIGTATSCADFTHTVSFAFGDLISLQFTTQAADTLAGVKAFVLWY